MSLVDILPVEILLLIARFLSSKYLRARVERLLICKAWYQITAPLAFEDLRFSVASFHRFVEAAPHVQQFVLSNVRRLTFEAKNWDENYTLMIKTTRTLIDRGAGSFQAENVTSNDLCQRHGVEIIESLDHLTKYLSKMTKLNHFQLKVAMSSLTSQLEDDLHCRAIANILCSLPKSVTFLTIDLPGETPISYHETPDHNNSVCHLLSTEDLLPSLRHLRLRTQTVCPKIFTSASPFHHPLLETLVLNISPWEKGFKDGLQAVYCREYGPRKPPFHLDMINAAEKAAIDFPRLKTLRILYPKLPSLHVRSHDVVSHRTVELAEEDEWDDLDWNDEGYTDFDAAEESDSYVCVNSNSDGQ